MKSMADSGRVTTQKTITLLHCHGTLDAVLSCGCPSAMVQKRMNILIQVYHGGRWHDAATVAIKQPDRGLRSPCTVDYELAYFTAFGSEDLVTDTPAVDHRALSVGVPVDMEFRSLPRWPAFLLDLLPQGHARRRLARELGFDNPDLPAVEVPLLLRGAGNPIGNLRVAQAWASEQARVAAAAACPGLSMQDILARSDRFLHVTEHFALVASGSSGVQGEWPKILLTQAADQLWYPDSIVADAKARDHVIVKLGRAKHREDSLILAAEAPYLEIARTFGLRVARPLIFAPNVLVIPRFDRWVEGQGIVRLGQESLVSALGIAEFGYLASHEQYLEVITRVTSNPAQEIVEYVLRDLLNYAMGNPDNHGRNTALQKGTDSTIRLAPLFDFAPMKLDPGVITRSTRWACMKDHDSDPDWPTICETVGKITEKHSIPSAKLAVTLSGKAEFLRQIPKIAAAHGVATEVIERACRAHGMMADKLAALGP